jgi:hypothetical protein
VEVEKMKEISVNFKFDDDVIERINEIVKHENISIDTLFMDIIKEYIRSNKVFYTSKFDGLWRWTYDKFKKDYLFTGNIWTEIGNDGKGVCKGTFTYNRLVC